VLAWLGWAAAEMDDYDRSIAWYEESLALYRQIDGPRARASVAFVLNGLGNVALERDDHAAARAHYEESLAIRRELSELAGVVCTLGNLGFTAHSEGDYPRARAYFRESLALARETQDRRHVALDIFGLAMVAQSAGQTVQAAQLLGQTDWLLHSLGTNLGSPGSTRYEHMVVEVRAALGEDAFAVAWAEGQALSLEQAVALVLGDGSTG